MADDYDWLSPFVIAISVTAGFLALVLVVVCLYCCICKNELAKRKKQRQADKKAKPPASGLPDDDFSLSFNSTNTPCPKSGRAPRSEDTNLYLPSWIWRYHMMTSEKEIKGDVNHSKARSVDRKYQPHQASPAKQPQPKMMVSTGNNAMPLQKSMTIHVQDTLRNNQPHSKFAHAPPPSTDRNRSAFVVNSSTMPRHYSGARVETDRSSMSDYRSVDRVQRQHSETNFSRLSSAGSSSYMIERRGGAPVYKPNIRVGDDASASILTAGESSSYTLERRGGAPVYYQQNVRVKDDAKPRDQLERNNRESVSGTSVSALVVPALNLRQVLQAQEATRQTTLQNEAGTSGKSNETERHLASAEYSFTSQQTTDVDSTEIDINPIYTTVASLRVGYDQEIN